MSTPPPEPQPRYDVPSPPTAADFSSAIEIVPPSSSTQPTAPYSVVHYVPAPAPTPVPQPVPAGWYHHPQSGLMRWWDGATWTEHFAPGGVQRSTKDTTTAYLLAIFLGGFAAYLFYLGRTGAAVGMLVATIIGIMTAWLAVGFFIIGGVWIWLIVDLFLIPSYVRAANQRRY